MNEESDYNSRLTSCVNFVERKLDFFTKNVIISLLIIGALSLLLRLLFFEPSIPIRQDAVSYFWYANDVSILKKIIPIYHNNNGWSIFLSIFFSVFHYNNFIEYTILQRLVSISISVLTIIPVYYLGTRFFDKSYSLMASVLFSFEPHIIQNSLLGLTEPLYIFLGTSALALFLSSHKKVIYASFALVALCTIVRTEGIVLLPIFSIMFVIRFRKEKMIARQFFLSLVSFGVILLATMITNFQISNDDGITGRVVGMTYGSIIEPEKSGFSFPNLLKSAETLAKRLGQSMIPYFALFVPFGSLLIWRSRNYQTIFVIGTMVVFLLVAFRIFFIAYDLRYLFFTYPLFCIISVFTIKHIGNTVNNKNIFLILLISSTVLLSWFFLYNETHYEYEKEALKFANYLVENVSVINNYYPESGYIYAAWASSHLTFPVLSSSVTYTGPGALDYVKNTFNYLEKSADSLEEYIKLARDQGLTHIVVDGDENRISYFNDLFHNEKKYSYLIKEFDSREHGYKYYHVKVFKINYDRFDSIKEDK